jgi:hypothetical protein
MKWTSGRSRTGAATLNQSGNDAGPEPVVIVDLERYRNLLDEIGYVPEPSGVVAELLRDARQE